MTLPDDPYKALGVAHDAPAAAIKLAYRKLVLKCHPDKVADDSMKQSAADQFHKIQTAWEIVGDEEKRVRYDAQARLSALRKEVLEREGQPGLRRAQTDLRPTAAYRAAAEPRGPPSRSYSDFRVEEIRPEDAAFSPRAERRDFDYGYEKAKRASPREDRTRPKPTRESTKETDRARQREKVRQTTKATNRDRDYKYAHAQVDSDPESDEYYASPRQRRSPREEEEQFRTRDKYFEQARREQEAAASARYTDEKRSKMAEARDYIKRTETSRHESTRRPSPNRMSSSREHIEITKRADGRPVTIRHGSGRSRNAARDDAEVPRRRRDDDRDIRSSSEFEEPHRRPPGLNQAKSAPDNIRLPPMDKPRSYSVQHEADEINFIPQPVRRTESMPQQSRREDARGRSTRSSLRQTQMQDEYETRKQTVSYPGLGIKKAYADDHEYATPDGYITEPREPQPSRRMTRSPSPIKDRERNRGSSSRHASPKIPPINTRTTSTSYMYSPKNGLENVPQRPKLSREGSSQSKSMLYGELPTTRSPREREPMSAPVDGGVRIREIRPDVKVATGYTASVRRPSDGRSPSYYRSPSFANPVSA